jgi:hypothetical protein
MSTIAAEGVSHASSLCVTYEACVEEVGLRGAVRSSEMWHAVEKLTGVSVVVDQKLQAKLLGALQEHDHISCRVMLDGDSVITADDELQNDILGCGNVAISKLQKSVLSVIAKS